MEKNLINHLSEKFEILFLKISDLLGPTPFK